jgi:hypothetical protein
MANKEYAALATAQLVDQGWTEDDARIAVRDMPEPEEPFDRTPYLATSPSLKWLPDRRLPLRLLAFTLQANWRTSTSIC